MCKVYQNVASLQRYYNSGKSSSITADPSAGISNLVITNQNGTLSCSFRREKNMPGVANYTNLNNSTYILMASGPVNNDGIIYFI